MASPVSPASSRALPPGRPWHQRFNRALRHVLTACLNRPSPANGARPVGPRPAADTVRQILIVRVNYRLGNVVLMTSILPVLQAAYPGAVIDVLAGAGPDLLLAGLPLRHVERVSRRMLRAPRAVATLLRRLRRRRYDLVIDASLGSFSGTLYGWLSGAPHRLGGCGRADRLLTWPLDLPAQIPAYGMAPFLASQLGVKTSALPRLTPPTASARAEARAVLRKLSGDAPLPPSGAHLGVFVGGHHEKRYPAEHWIDCVRELGDHPWMTLVFIGPEERELAPRLAAAITHPRVLIVPPQALSIFVTLLADLALLVTPDSGPLHIAAALDVPVLALIQDPKSLGFLPPGDAHRFVHQPTPAELLTAIRQHPAAARLLNPTPADAVQN